MEERKENSRKEKAMDERKEKPLIWALDELEPKTQISIIVKSVFEKYEQLKDAPALIVPCKAGVIICLIDFLLSNTKKLDDKGMEGLEQFTVNAIVKGFKDGDCEKRKPSFIYDCLTLCALRQIIYDENVFIVFEPKENKCLKCGKMKKDLVPPSKLRTCASCESVKYCSTKCQREDWKEHKPKCKIIARAKHKQN